MNGNDSGMKRPTTPGPRPYRRTTCGSAINAHQVTSTRGSCDYTQEIFGDGLCH